MVRRFQFPVERVVCAVMEHAQQHSRVQSNARSRDVLGFARGVWMMHMEALGIPVHLVAARTWQEWAGLGGRTKRKDRLAQLPGVAAHLLRNEETYHHDEAAAVAVGVYWLRNGGLDGQG